MDLLCCVHRTRHSAGTDTKKDSHLKGDCLGAENETRTRDPDLGKVVLYQLSYFRKNFSNFCEVVGCGSEQKASSLFARLARQLRERDCKDTAKNGISKFF